MFCDEVLERVELVASGEAPADERMHAHLSGCPGCRAAFAHAREIERLLQSRPAPRPSAQFTSRIMGRIRRDRWRREQFLDAGFNVVMGVVALAVISGFWLLLSQTGIGEVSSGALGVVNAAVLTGAKRMLPSLPLYLGAAGLVATALGVWWWAERSA